MRLTQGTFSYLPALTDEEIEAPVRYIIQHGWAVSIEYTDAPSPYNVYWHMWGLPMFDLEDPAPAMYECRKCREAFPHHYIKVNGYDPSPMWQAQRSPSSPTGPRRRNLVFAATAPSLATAGGSSTPWNPTPPRSPKGSAIGKSKA